MTRPDWNQYTTNDSVVVVQHNMPGFLSITIRKAKEKANKSKIFPKSIKLDNALNAKLWLNCQQRIQHVFTCDWHARNVEKGSAITAGELACIRSPEPASHEVIGMKAVGWRTGEMPLMLDRLILFMSIPIPSPMPIPIPMPIGAIMDIWSCCCMAIGNIIGGILILLIIWTWACNCFRYSITSSSIEALSVCSNARKFSEWIPINVWTPKLVMYHHQNYISTCTIS